MYYEYDQDMIEILDSYPKLDFRGNDQYFDNFEDFENYSENTLSDFEIDDRGDVFTQNALESEFINPDWYDRKRKEEIDCGNVEVNYILGFVRSAQKFFIIFKIICENE